MYIIVTDAKGIEVGYDTGVFRPLTHRVLIENGSIYGADNFLSYFRDAKGQFNQVEWQMFVQLMYALPSGQYRELSWQRE